jgi:hypothetical protein
VFLLTAHYYHFQQGSIGGNDYDPKAGLRNRSPGAKSSKVALIQTETPTASPTALPTTIAPTAEPTAVPTTHPTAAPTATPTMAPTVAQANVVVITPPQEVQHPTYMPTLPKPTVKPSPAPTKDTRFKVLWLTADNGLALSSPSADNNIKPVVSSDINCWSSVSHLDQKSADVLQSELYHKPLQDAMLAAPIPFSDQLIFLPANFCISSTKPIDTTAELQPQYQHNILTAHAITHESLPLPVMTLPIGYSWTLLPQATVDETRLTFRTYFFVFYVNAGAMLARPSSTHHVCYFVDHRQSVEHPAMKMCFFDKQMSLQTATNDYILTAVPIDTSNEDSYVIASYRIAFSNSVETHDIDTVQMYISGENKYSLVSPVENSQNQQDAALGLGPFGNTMEFICTDANPLYCSSRFLLAETILFEEQLSDDKAFSVIGYLQEKYKMKAGEQRVPVLPQVLPAELMTAIKAAFHKDVATPAPSKAAIGILADYSPVCLLILNVFIDFTTAQKLTCENGDPFGAGPVDSFIVPDNANEEDRKKWKAAIMKMMSEIARLRTLLENFACASLFGYLFAEVTLVRG